MATLSLRMLTLCLFAAAILNCSNYMFVKLYYPDVQKLSKYYYPRASSDVITPKSVVHKKNWTLAIQCKSDMAPTNKQDDYNNLNANSSQSPGDYQMVGETNKCPDIPPGLGPISQSDSQISLTEFETKFGDLGFGGIYQPTTCDSRHSVAVIIAYRGCRRYLAMFLFILHPLLMKQQLNYQVFVIEQSNNTQMFNRGKLLNVGFVEAQKYHKNGWNCFILHEAHIVPTDSRNLYRCSWYPRQLAVTVEINDKSSYIPKLGGAVAMTPEQYLKVNGFSNNYWGNDADFEDLYTRILKANYFIEKSLPELGGYRTLKKYSGAERITSAYMETVSPLYLLDGLTSLSYNLDSFELRRMYTYIRVNIDETDVSKVSSKLHKLLNPVTYQTTSQVKATNAI